MTQETKTVSMAVRCMVTLEMEVEMGLEGAKVVSVRHASPPSPGDVMNALDADGQLQDLDDAYAAAAARKGSR